MYSSISETEKTIIWKEQAGMRYAIYKVNGSSASLIDVVNTNRYTISDAGTYSVTAINDDNIESIPSKLIEVK